MNIFSNKKILVTGGHGFLGKHLVNKILSQNPKELRVPTSKEIDLRKANDCKKAVHGIDIIIHLAAVVGGIGFNKEHPADIFYDNILINTNLIHESYIAQVEKIVSIGTVCSYPKFAKIPFKVEGLWNGYPEETNAPYGLVKKMALVQLDAYYRQYKLKYLYFFLTNLYGPGDDFSDSKSHVVPALIKKIMHAKSNNLPSVTLWGTGTATREFLYVEDAANSILKGIEYYDDRLPLNIGSDDEISIKSLAMLIKKLCKYNGKILWDIKKPNGQPRRKVYSKNVRKLINYFPNTPLVEGLRKTIYWYNNQVNNAY